MAKLGYVKQIETKNGSDRLIIWVKDSKIQNNVIKNKESENK